MPFRILVVDDEKGIADTLAAILTCSGYESLPAYNAQQALAVLPDFRPNLVITDVVMPGMSGIELVRELQTRSPQTTVMLLSGNAATEDLLTTAGTTLGQIVVLPKPFPPRLLLKNIAELARDFVDSPA